METATIVAAFVTLFVVIDPIGLAPMFVALTKGANKTHRRAVAVRGCLIAIFLLTIFGLFGEKMLFYVGISMPAFQISGGILLFLTALDMLFERRAQRRQGQSAQNDDPSVFPLAMPLIAGPGAMATMILLTERSSNWTDTLIMHLVMIAVIIMVLAFFLVASIIERALGETGINVVTRLMGMLLAALSVQFVLNGLAGIGLASVVLG